MNAQDFPLPAAQVEDRPADVSLSAPLSLADGFRPYERYDVTLRHAHGGVECHPRDILRGGRVVGVIPVDLQRDEIVLIRQFRLPAHLATGKGEMVEIVAGRVEGDESLEVAARRECLEEIGVAAGRIVPVLNFMPTPGLTDEYATLFVAEVNSRALPERAGVEGEAETTLPFALPISTVLAALEAGGMTNGYALMALQWLALHRARLPALLAG